MCCLCAEKEDGECEWRERKVWEKWGEPHLIPPFDLGSAPLTGGHVAHLWRLCNHWCGWPLCWLGPLCRKPHLVTMHSSPLTIGTRWLPYSIILCPLIELTPIVLTLQGWASIVRPMRPFLALHPSCFLSLFIHFLVYFFLGSRPIVCFLYFYTTPMLACTTLLVFLWL